MDSYGHAAALHLMRHTFDGTGKMSATGEPVRMPAKIDSGGGRHAAEYGAGPRRSASNVFLDGKWFQAVDEDGQPVKPERVAKPKASAC